MKVIRETLVANNQKNLKFDVEGFKFLVKNFTEDDIYVSLDSDVYKPNAIKIPSGTAQECCIHEICDLKYATDTVRILSLVDGEVEVQCTLW